MVKPLTKPDYVIFDMDGTTVRHVNPAMLSLLETLDNIIYKIARLFSREREIVDFSGAVARPRGLLVHRVLHKLRRKEVGQIVQPCPGIFLLLTLFRDNNIPMAIASNGLGKGYGHDILSTFGLADYFEIEIFREDIQKSKPHPDAILRAMKGFSKPPAAGDIVWFIGDRRKDMIAALAADKLSQCDIKPFSYGLNAAMAVLQNNVGTENIIMNYPDFFARVKPLFSEDATLKDAA